MSLLEPRLVYRPFGYQWAYEAYKQQNLMHWLPYKVSLADDIRDFDTQLSAAEKNLVTQILRFFVQGDVAVAENYSLRLNTVFRVPEVQMMLNSFVNMEAIHVDSYSYLIDTLGLPEVEYSAFLDNAAMRAKYDYLQGFDVSTTRGLAKTLGVFGGFMEGVSLFASFAVLRNFARAGNAKLMGMDTIIDWSIRDETLHADSICRLYRTVLEENPEVNTPDLHAEMLDACRDMVALEDNFIDTCFELGAVPGLTPEELKSYIRFVANSRLGDLNLPALWPEITENPLPWVTARQKGREHTNFFEQRPTAYAKGVIDGNWDYSVAQTMADRRSPGPQPAPLVLLDSGPFAGLDTELSTTLPVSSLSDDADLEAPALVAPVREAADANAAAE